MPQFFFVLAIFKHPVHIDKVYLRIFLNFFLNKLGHNGFISFLKLTVNLPIKFLH
jgi:hypothetical protein